MRSDDELLKVACALLEIECETGEEETAEVMRLLDPCTKEEKRKKPCPIPSFQVVGQLIRANEGQIDGATLILRTNWTKWQDSLRKIDGATRRYITNSETSPNRNSPTNSGEEA